MPDPRRPIGCTHAGLQASFKLLPHGYIDDVPPSTFAILGYTNAMAVFFWRMGPDVLTQYANHRRRFTRLAPLTLPITIKILVFLQGHCVIPPPTPESLTVLLDTANLINHIGGASLKKRR